MPRLQPAVRGSRSCGACARCRARGSASSSRPGRPIGCAASPPAPTTRCSSRSRSRSSPRGCARSTRRCRAPSEDPEPPLSYGELTIDIARRRVEVAGRAVDVRRREFDLLAFLARHPGEVFTREELIAQVWRAPAGVGASTVTVHVRRLRAAAGARPVTAAVAETVHGVGYRFRP